MDFVENIGFLDKMFEAVYLVDRNRTILLWNKAAETITGFLATEVIGKKCCDNILKHVNEKGKSLCWEDCHLKKTLQDGQHRELSIYLHHKQGHRVLVNIRTIPLFDHNDSSAQCSLAVFTRGGAETNFEQFQDLARKAFIDSLTGIPNRDYINNKLRSLLDYTETGKIENFGIMFIELDNLIKINDEYGKNVANKTIKLISKILIENMQPGELIARMGGGLFIVITSIDKKSILLNWANKISLLIQQSKIPEHDNLIFKVGIGGLIAETGQDIGFVYKGLDTELKNSFNMPINISIRD